MRCGKAQKLISAELDGELDQRLTAALAAHIDECARCQRFRDDVARSDQALEVLPAADPRSDFAARVVAALPDHEESHRGLSGWIIAIRPARAAAAVIGLASGTLLALGMNGSSGMQPAADESADAVLTQSFEAIPDDSAAARYLALLQESEN